MVRVRITLTLTYPNPYPNPSPNPRQPKSYLHDEPAVKRANENQFDAVLQLTEP